MKIKTVSINIIIVTVLASLFIYSVNSDLDIEKPFKNNIDNNKLDKKIQSADREELKTLAIINPNLKRDIAKKIVSNHKISKDNIDDNDEDNDEDNDDYANNNYKRKTGGYKRNFIFNEDIPEDTDEQNIKIEKKEYQDKDSVNFVKEENNSSLGEAISKDETGNKKETSSNNSDDKNSSNRSGSSGGYNPYEWAVSNPFGNEKDNNITDKSGNVIKTDETIEDLIESADGDVGNLVLLRLFKQEHKLEVWMSVTGKFKLIKDYDIQDYTGELGPKLSNEDRQSPEGYYSITPIGLVLGASNDYQIYITFPNKFDKEHNVTDGVVSIHNSNIQEDGFILKQNNINEIAELIKSAFDNRYKSIPIYIYPFKMTDENMQQVKDSQWYDFWINIKEGYDYFENYHRLPVIKVENGKYTFHIL